LVIERDEVVTSGKRVYVIRERAPFMRFWMFPLIKLNCWPIAGAEVKTSPSASAAASACRVQIPIGWAANLAFAGRSVGPSASPFLSRRLSGILLTLLRIVLFFYTAPCFPCNIANSLKSMPHATVMMLLIPPRERTPSRASSRVIWAVIRARTACYSWRHWRKMDQPAQ
jgi:hypothetical protein